MLVLWDFSIILCFTQFLFILSCREKQRKCGPDGFVDSVRLRQNYRSDKDEDTDDEQRSPSRVTVVDLTNKTSQSQKDFDKRLKLVEVCAAYQNKCLMLYTLLIYSKYLIEQIFKTIYLEIYWEKPFQIVVMFSWIILLDKSVVAPPN